MEFKISEVQGIMKRYRALSEAILNIARKSHQFQGGSFVDFEIIDEDSNNMVYVNFETDCRGFMNTYFVKFPEQYLELSNDSLVKAFAIDKEIEIEKERSFELRLKKDIEKNEKELFEKLREKYNK